MKYKIYFIYYYIHLKYIYVEINSLSFMFSEFNDTVLRNKHTYPAYRFNYIKTKENRTNRYKMLVD